MTKNITFNREMTLANMFGAAKYMPRSQQVIGFDADGYSAPYATGEEFTPVGLVLHWLGVDVEAIERTSARHLALCGDEDCFICDEDNGGADPSIYSKWVQAMMVDTAGVSFTVGALDLLWSAETSGQPLWQWLEDQGKDVYRGKEPF
jgi:hypothetical protein